TMRWKCTETPSGAIAIISVSTVGFPGGTKKPSRARQPIIAPHSCLLSPNRILTARSPERHAGQRDVEARGVLCEPVRLATKDAAMPADDHTHDHGSELSEMQLRVKALETILTEKGYVDPAALDQIVENFETRIGQHIGARVVARAWIDPEFKRRLLE